MKHNLITDGADSSILADFPIKVLFNLFCHQLPDSFLEFPLPEVSLLLKNLQRLLPTYHFYFQLFQLKVGYRLAPVISCSIRVPSAHPFWRGGTQIEFHYLL